MRAIEWVEGDIVILDQTLLPHRQEERVLGSTNDVAEAIETMRVRGAPAPGRGPRAGPRRPSASPKVVLERAEEAGKALAATRPTAVNLAWAIERVLHRGHSVGTPAGAERRPA